MNDQINTEQVNEAHISPSVLNTGLGWQPIEIAPKDNKKLLLLATFYNGQMTDIDFDGTWDYEVGWFSGKEIGRAHV